MKHIYFLVLLLVLLVSGNALRLNKTKEGKKDSKEKAAEQGIEAETMGQALRQFSPIDSTQKAILLR